jgi:CTP synthase (UTP-ammonia lyase)
VIEFARNVLGIAEATSTEFDARVGIPLRDQRAARAEEIEGLGGTMRLGAQDVASVAEGSLASFLYGGATVRERFRHRYEVEPEWIERLEAAGSWSSAGATPSSRSCRCSNSPLNARQVKRTVPVGRVRRTRISSRPSTTRN